MASYSWGWGGGNELCFCIGSVYGLSYGLILSPLLNKIIPILNFKNHEKNKIKIMTAFPQWLRICLSMQGTGVRSLVQEDSTCHWATKPHEPQLLKPTCCNYWICVPRARDLQQEKPLQREATEPQQRVAPAHWNYRKSSTCNNKDPAQSK